MLAHGVTAAALLAWPARPPWAAVVVLVMAAAAAPTC
jgi:hypothetical protein